MCSDGLLAFRSVVLRLRLARVVRNTAALSPFYANFVRENKMNMAQVRQLWLATAPSNQTKTNPSITYTVSVACRFMTSASRRSKSRCQQKQLAHPCARRDLGMMFQIPASAGMSAIHRELGGQNE